MGYYGTSAWGFSWYELNEYDYYTTYSINAGGTIAELKGPTTIFASAKIAELLPTSIDAGGTVAELKGPESINASANVAERLSQAINASANVAQLKSAEIYASGHIKGDLIWAINAGGNIADLKTPHSINASAVVAQTRLNYVNAIGTVALLRQNAINAGGFILGYPDFSINVSATIAEVATQAINASATVAAKTTSQLFAEGKVAEQKTHSINAGGYLGGYFPHAIDAGGHIGQVAGPTSINASGKVAEKITQAINASATVAQRITSSINAAANVSQIAYSSINASGKVALPAGSHYITASGLIIASPYYYLNEVDVTLLMLEGLKPHGPERKLSKRYYPGQEKVLVSEEGFDVKEFSFETFHSSLAAAFDYIDDVMDSEGDMKFYPGDSLWFHKVGYINVERVKRRGSYHFVLNTTVTLEKPWLYLDLASTWTPGSIMLPRTSADIINNGHYDTPLELLKITGHYLAGYPMGLTYAIMNGVNQVSILSLVDKLLSEEIIELDEDGILTSTYADDFASATRFGHDAVQSGCTCAGGKVTVGSGGYFYYRFRGPWPNIKNIELTAKLNIISGSPVIEVSNDSMATWTTAVTTANIGNNISKLYYLEGSDHYSDIYVRVRAPSGSSVEVEDVSFVAQRRTTGTATPVIAAGSTRQIKISDGAGSTHSVTIEATFRERRRAI